MKKHIIIKTSRTISVKHNSVVAMTHEGGIECTLSKERLMTKR